MADSRNYAGYRNEVSKDISQCLSTMEVQPILFVGSGLSQRYFDAPNWEELLSKLAEDCPKIENDFAYYRQSYDNLRLIGQEFAKLYKEWAWDSGEDTFPDHLYSADSSSDVFIKYYVSEYLKDITPSSAEEVEDEYKRKEIELLKEVQPYAIITTNYDTFLENIFDKHDSVIGQNILRSNFTSVGEIFKIHGCVTKPNSIVLTEEDYIDFERKKKYLSSKLLTYFAEHPLFLIGYRPNDPNVQRIFSDIDEILSPEGDIIDNIYIMQWDEDVSEDEHPKREEMIEVDGSKSVRIKSITYDSMSWVLESISGVNTIPNVDPKILRSLIARTFKLVRHDIPQKSIELDFEALEHAAESEDGMAKLYGVTTLSDPSVVSAKYPYIISEVAEELGYSHWYYVNEHIEEIEEETGINIKESDNRYHFAMKSGSTVTHKYSEAAVDLIRKVRDGEDYTVDLQPTADVEPVSVTDSDDD